MTASIIEPQAPSPSVQQEIVTTWVLLEADPNTASLAPAHETFYQQKWRAIVAQETDLLVEAHRADALVDNADQALDDFVDELDTTLLRLVGKDRTDALYVYFFGKKRAHELKRPTLGGQLETMRGFAHPLKTSAHAELAVLGDRLEILIARADDTAKRQQNAAEALKTFRTLGARKECIDELNALRKSTAGTLSEMPHKFPEKRLPADYAERFFKRGPKRKSAAKEITSADLQIMIAEQKQALAALEAQLVEVIAKEEAEAKAKADAAHLQVELAEAEKAAAEAAAKVAAIKAKMG